MRCAGLTGLVLQCFAVVRAELPPAGLAPVVSASAVAESFRIWSDAAGNASQASGSSCASFDGTAVRSMRVWRVGGREDAQAMHLFQTSVSGKQYLLKVGRYHDLKRELLAGRRADQCGFTQLAGLCGIFALPSIMQGSGAWRRRNIWERFEAEGTAIPVKQGLTAINADHDGERGECVDCLYADDDDPGKSSVSDATGIVLRCPRIDQPCTVLTNRRYRRSPSTASLPLLVCQM